VLLSETFAPPFSSHLLRIRSLTIFLVYDQTGEIISLAGCDFLTISPSLLDKLQKSDEEMKQVLSKEKAQKEDPMEKVSFVDNEGAFRWSLLQVSSKFDYFRLLRKLRLAQILTNLSLFASLTGSNGLRQGESFLSLASTVHELTLEYNFSYTRVSASSLLTLMNSSLSSRRSSKSLLPLSEHTHSLTMSIKLDLLCYPSEVLL